MPRFDKLFNKEITINPRQEEKMKKVGYARISTEYQNLEMQIDGLKKEGCEEIYTDTATGVKTSRPGLDQALARLETGDVLVVWRLDRLGRTMKHLVQLVEDLKAKGIGFKSISDGSFDTTTATGELIFHLFSALAQFEASLTRERVNAGIAMARARGKMGGRKPMSPKDPRVLTAGKMHADKSIPIDEICRTLHISRATLYNYVHLYKRSLANAAASGTSKIMEDGLKKGIVKC